MNLMKITKVTERFGISSRTLRYYEQVGLLESVRPDFEKYRFYDSENIHRLQQILILRKMQIPVKDILRIYENKDMETLVESFVKRIEELDDQISTLFQLKIYMNDFLDAMKENGITQISALPFVYEKVEEKLLTNHKTDLSLETLNTINNKMVKPLDMDIITLPAMMVMTSVKTESKKSEIDDFWNWLSANQIPFGKPGSRTMFEYQKEDDIVMMQKLTIQSDMIETKNQSIKESPFECKEFVGGLFAVSSAYIDEDLGELQNQMLQAFDDNPNFEIDFLHNGNLRHETLVESVFSSENNREKINVYIPLRQRKPNFVDYPEFQIIENISLEEIEKENPVLREYTVDFHKITPIYHPHYQVLDNGEAQFIAWISERKLDSNVAVRLPFRVDIEFLAEEESEKYLWGTTEGSLWFSHGNCTYTINGENYADRTLKKHALVFQQPILGNEFIYEQITNYPHHSYNKLTWIVGEKHFAVILNGEICFCGIDFPYMNMNLHLQTPQTIMIGTNGQGKKLFRSIKISQLKTISKTNTTQGVLRMQVKQSNNILVNVRQIVHPEKGQNYWFNGCAGYIMECLEEKEFDYWFFAGLSGENFTQIYSKNGFLGNGVVDYQLSQRENHSFIEELFAKCGYASTFVPLKEILFDRKRYIQMVMDYIDKGIPVILNDYGNNPHNRFSWGVIVGYADYGRTLLYIGADATTPDSILVEDLLPKGYEEQSGYFHGWLFIGEKQEDKDLAKIYRERIVSLPQLLNYENEHYCFGTKAFLAWAKSIETGYFEHIKPEEFDNWDMYTVYVCCLATNSSSCKPFLKKAMELNPDMTFINDIIECYNKTGQYWNNDNGTDLEALGGGFNVTMDTLQDEKKCKKIADKLREFASCIDEVISIIK